MMKIIICMQALWLLSISSVAAQNADKNIRGAVAQAKSQRALCGDNCDDDTTYDDHYHGKALEVDSENIDHASCCDS